MFDDDRGVAGRDQAAEHSVHAVHVAGVKPDAGFVDHEERVDEVGAERGREVDAFDLAPGERAALAVKRQIPEPHVGEKADAGDHFAGAPSLRSRRGCCEPPLKEPAQAPDGRAHEFVNVEAGKRVVGFRRHVRPLRDEAQCSAEASGRL